MLRAAQLAGTAIGPPVLAINILGSQGQAQPHITGR